jgi:CelD/BcsL family acetyltransferase involved in cellulose biosynthesis
MLGNGGLNVEVIQRVDALAPVLDPWRRLAAARGNAFITPEWYLSALAMLDDGTAPAVAVVRDDDDGVRGLLPLLELPTTGAVRLAAFPTARFGDIFHPVAAAADDDEIAAAVAPALAQHLGSRCHIDLGRVDAGARWWRRLARAWPSRMTPVLRPEEALPYIALTGSSWEGYLATRSRQLRNQVGRKMRGLRRNHHVRLRRSLASEEVGGDIAALFELHDARWAGLRKSSSIADPWVREFHRRFAVEALERGWLRLYLLEVDGVAVAGWYGWRVGDRFSYYQAGFDPAWSRYSVGFLLLAETVREAFSEGASEYDLLLGDEAFKSRFATGSRFARPVLLVPPLSRGRVTATVQSWLRSGARAMPSRRSAV